MNLSLLAQAIEEGNQKEIDRLLKALPARDMPTELLKKIIN